MRKIVRVGRLVSNRFSQMTAKPKKIKVQPHATQTEIYMFDTQKSCYKVFLILFLYFFKSYSSQKAY